MVANPPFARSRPLLALLLLLSVMIGGAVEAAACEPEWGHSTDVSSHVDGGDRQNSDQKRETHGTCVHGHCHHWPQFMRDEPAPSTIAASSAPHQGLAEARLTAIEGDTPKRPPRA